MKKRVAATLLWFFSMWYAGAFIAEVFGLSPALGPILGTAAAAIVGGDPRGIIWKRPVREPASTATPLDPAATTASASPSAQTAV